MRDDGFREELVRCFATLRERLERIYQRRVDEYGLPHGADRPVMKRANISSSSSSSTSAGSSEFQSAQPSAIAMTMGVGVRGGVLERSGDAP